VSVLNPIRLWHCREHGLVEQRNSARRCPHSGCGAFLGEQVSLVREQDLTQSFMRVVELVRRQEAGR
jgi:hypothetical protein